MLLQMVTTHNLTSLILFFYVGVLVLCLLPFELLMCDKQFKNALVDAILFAFIFLVSTFCYIQAWKAKVKSLIEEIYSLLIKLQASLEAKIALINANDLAYNNSIAVKTAIIVLLLTSIALFAYWWLGGGGDDSGGGGNIDIASTSSESINSLTSNNVASISTILQSATAFDKLVNSAIESSSGNVKHCIPDENESRTLGKVKGYFNGFDCILKDLEQDLDTVLGEIKKTPSDFMNEETCTSLKCAVNGLFEIQRELHNYNPRSALNIHEKNELESLAQQLLNLLETQSDFSATCDNALPNLTSAAAFYYMLTESKHLISALKISMDGLTELLKRGTNYSNRARALVGIYLKAVESLPEDFKFWSDTNIDVNYTYAAKFVERFRDMCKNIKIKVD